jgi:hypothetical protein
MHVCTPCHRRFAHHGDGSKLKPWAFRKRKREELRQRAHPSMPDTPEIIN